MTYSRGTDNDEGAARIIYEDGKPVVSAYYPKTTAAELDRLVRRANAADKLAAAMQSAYDLLLTGHRAVIDRANESGDDEECDRYEAVLKFVRDSLTLKEMP